MSRLVWLITGIGVGFAAAHGVDRTPRGHAFLQKVDGYLTEFTDAVVDGYHGRERELPGVRSDPTDPMDAGTALR